MFDVVVRVRFADLRKLARYMIWQVCIWILKLRSAVAKRVHNMERQTESRVGRNTQAYSKDGSRLVSGGIVLNESKDKVLMISSSNHKNKWIVPKGGVENDEVADFTVTALRECWEEAGVECAVVKFLGVIADKRSQDKLKRVEEEFEKNPQLRDVDDYLKVVPKSEFHFYELKILELSNEWPEDHKRDRKWCDYATAKLELIKSKRLELLEALDRSSILKN